MKSIRLSLIVYVLLLMTGSLGAVSWFSYHTTEAAMHERQRDAQEKIAAQYAKQCDAARHALDQQISIQARALASRPLINLPYEAMHAATMVGLGSAPRGPIDVQLWMPYARPSLPMRDIGRGFIYMPFFLVPESKRFLTFFPWRTHLEDSEHLVLDADTNHPQGYFQTYRGTDGQTLERSVSMGDASFALSDEQKKQRLYTEHFDEVELTPGVKVRRVTLKTPAISPGFVGPWRGFGPFGGKGPAPAPKGGGKTPGQLEVYVQFAADVAPMNAEIYKAGETRDKELANLNRSIDEQLDQLRSQMTWILFGTLAAVWLGGFVVIHFGLAPLSKMSEAVSQVSATNFQLDLDPERLPHELRPIAERLQIVLDHLQKAFLREKQAAADISHELRTPLAALMTTLDVGLKKSRSAEAYREILEECKASGQHMYQLVERLLTLARLDAGADQFRCADADVTDIAITCADLIRPLARARGVSIRLHLGEPINTQTDPNKLREVLVNLLHNAIEYNKPNGFIDLTVERINSHIRMEVRDTGIGIKPEEMSHLFERFYRADPSRHADTPHAGLGLAIVKRYVELMGGTIHVESSEAGSAFIVEIPFVERTHPVSTAIRAEPVLASR